MPNAVRTSGDENPNRALNPATDTATRTSATIMTSGDTRTLSHAVAHIARSARGGPDVAGEAVADGVRPS